jgi:hypothetical protein
MSAGIVLGAADTRHKFAPGLTIWVVRDNVSPMSTTFSSASARGIASRARTPGSAAGARTAAGGSGSSFFASTSHRIDFLRAAHLGAPRQQSVQAYAAFADGFRTLLAWPPTARREARPVADRPRRPASTGAAAHPLDLDLMVMYDGELDPYVQRVTQGILYALWDPGCRWARCGAATALAMARTGSRPTSVASALPRRRPPAFQSLPQGAGGERVPEGLRSSSTRCSPSGISGTGVRGLAVHGSPT